MTRLTCGLVLVLVFLGTTGCTNSRSSISPGCSSSSCGLPPQAACDGNVVVVYSETGRCEENECVYAQTRTSCSVGMVCDEGKCVVEDDLCDDVVCLSPPTSSCNASSVVSYPAHGTCRGGECIYPPIYTSCNNWEVCMNAECISASDPCATITCDQPPGPVCSENTRVSYLASGTCEAGECVYPSVDEPCGNDATCVEGICDETRNPCEGITCDAPPRRTCALNTVIIYESSGSCEAGRCRYPASEEVCDEDLVCLEGSCVDPCAEVVCATPPGPVCNGNTVVSHRETGACVMGECSYEEVQEDCGSESLCLDGACVAVPQVGALVITEIMYDPNADDSGFEWFEVHNSTERDIYVGGLKVSDTPSSLGTTNQMLIPEGTIIRAGDYVVFAQSANALFSELDYHWEEWGTFVLANNDDELILTWGVTVIDRVDYNEHDDFPEARGASLSLDPGVDALGNDEGARWCFGETPYDAPGASASPKGYGTPGRKNPPCDFLCFQVDCPVLENTCLSPTVAKQYTQSGACDSATGLCSSEHVVNELDCVAENGGDLNYICRDGECVDGCEGVYCAAAPPASCEENALTTYQAAGACVGGKCHHEVALSLDCGEDTCMADADGAACFGDPCEGVSCAAPSAFCEGDVVVSYSDGGVCAEGNCDFSGVESRTACPEGSGCYQAECVRLPAPGELVITEYLANPDGADNSFEWFEVFNRTTEVLYLGGMVVKDLGTNHFTVPEGVFVQAGAYFVFASSAGAVLGEPDCNWSGLGNFQLTNSADEIVLMVGTEVIDEVHYSDCVNCFPDPNGRSVSLEPSLIQGENNVGDVWCMGSGSFGVGTSLGTPGGTNAPCFLCADASECPVPPAFCSASTSAVQYGGALCEGGVCDYSTSASVMDCETGLCNAGLCVSSGD
ncbi:MAG: lamin tail domain-containing protein [Myxococcota bacterium]|nr:lamin tail domain-containing protein [Myxococcota bacterium]